VKRDPSSIVQFRQIDLVDYLAQLGYHPTKISHNDYWYLSPLRNEKNASFKIDRAKNLWYDHGMGVGGDLIDFGMRFHGLSFSDLLHLLEKKLPLPIAVIPPQVVQEKKMSPILITARRQISDPHLVHYLAGRKIPLDLANRYCTEVEFELYGRKFEAIGFSNDCGGFELRSPQIKLSSSPKDVTTIRGRSETVHVFEGFFDFLSFKAMLAAEALSPSSVENDQDSYLVLNSLAFFERSRAQMENYPRICLHLDRDQAGTSRTQQALAWSSSYADLSQNYAPHKDLNDFLVATTGPIKPASQ
jgi:hypothetical protein